jgi:transcription elongation factor GreA
MQEPTSRRANLIKLGKLANSQRFEELEEAWLEAIEEGVYPVEDLAPIAGQVGRLGEPQKAGSLMWALVSTIEERDGVEAALRAARLAASELPGDAGLRGELMRLYGIVHADHPGLQPLLEHIFAADTGLDQAVERTERYLQLRPGTYVEDRSQLQPGRVESLDGELGTLTVVFSGRRHEYTDQQIEELTPLPEDHFRALFIFAPEKLRHLAEEDKVAFVELAIHSAKDHRLGYRDLKGQLIELLGEERWSGWWKDARAALRRARHVEMSGGSQPTFRLLAEGKSLEERVRANFDATPAARERLLRAVEYLDETAGNVVSARPEQEDAFAPDAALLTHLGNSAAKMAVTALSDDPELALACLAVHGEIAERGAPVARPNPQAAAKVLARIEDPAGLATRLPEPLLLRTLWYLRRNLAEGWAAVWAALLPRAGRRLSDMIGRGLLEAGKDVQLGKALRHILERPSGSPEALCWLWRARQGAGIARRLAGMPEAEPRLLLTAMLSLTDTTGRLLTASGEERHRRTLEMTQQVLLAAGAQPVKEVFARLDREDAAQMKSGITRNQGLSSAARGQLLGLLRSAHADLFTEQPRPWEEEVTYTTTAGLQRRQAELDRIIREEIPAVAKQIGEAAAFGDLSENAEFTAALEKRDQLTSRAASLEAELKSAKIIDPGLAAGDMVTIGSRVRARDLQSGQEVTFTFLGPWDSDPDRGILSYQAPVALAFMGKKAGEEVVYGEDDDQRRWEILAVGPGI